MKARKLILRKDETCQYLYLPYNWIWKVYDGKRLMYRGDTHQDYWIMEDRFMSSQNMKDMGWESINQQEAHKLYPNLTF